MGSTYIGPYIVQEKLGKGYFGKSRLCETVDKFPIAAKIIEVIPGVDRERVMNDLSAFYQHLSDFSTKGRNPLVRQRGMVELGERCFAVISEYCAQGNLEKRLQVRREWAEVVQEMKQLAQSVEWLHSRGVPHGDLKPTNVLLREGQLCLADPILPAFTACLRLRNIQGTCDYFSPEFFQGQISPASDVWSLGMIFLEMFHGRRIRELHSMEGCLKPSLGNNYPPLALLAAVTYPDLNSLIFSMLRPVPAERILIGEVVARLEEMVDPQLRTKQKITLKHQALQEYQRTLESHVVPLMPTIDQSSPFIKHFYVTNNKIIRIDGEPTRLQVLSKEKIPLGMWLITVTVFDYGVGNDQVAIGFTTEERRDERMSGDIGQSGSLAYWSNKTNEKGNLCLNGEWMDETLPHLQEGKGVLQMVVDTGERSIHWYVDNQWVRETSMPRNFWDQSLYFFMGLMGKNCTLQMLSP